MAGLGVGLLAAATGLPILRRAATAVEPIGTLWVNLVRMVVIPLVVCALVSGVAQLGDVRRLGRIGLRTLGYFAATVAIAVALGLAIGLVVVPLAPLDPAVTASLRETTARTAAEVGERAATVEGFGAFVLGLVPANPVKAAADGALLPLVVFSVLFGAGVASLEETKRRAVTDLADSVVAALIRLIEWIMALGPVGVACLAAPVAARFGVGMVTSLGVFLAAVIGGFLLFGAVVYGFSVRSLARLRVAPFFRAIAPAQAVGFTTTSSMAALPAMMDSAVRGVGVSGPVASFVLPLGATVYRPGGAINQVIGALFVAAFYGVQLSAASLVVVAASVFLMSFSVASIPSGTIFALAPTLMAVGLPVEGIGLLLGVDRVADMFRTGLHVTGHLTAAAVVARGEGEALG